MTKPPQWADVLGQFLLLMQVSNHFPLFSGMGKGRVAKTPAGKPGCGHGIWAPLIPFF